MQIIQGGVQDLTELTEAVAEEQAEFMTEILLSMDHLKFLLHSRQLTREQYDTLKEEITCQ
ncbi:MAG: hypothetical protein JRE23_03345 [Deltaproteobacteria bacterium]|nr:hypothetical protein [Deltaproteobacteria bacterium]